MSAGMWIEKGSAPMMVTMRFAAVTSEVNLRNLLHTSIKLHKQGIHPGFEIEDRHHYKSKMGVSVAPQK